jgi:4-hydroxy-tetrahydrodipicolinate synthase
MSASNVSEGLRGVTAGILTPFDEEGDILYDGLQSNVAYLESEGIDAFLACANISEYHSLSHEERVEVTRASVEATSEDSLVLGGVGGSTATATTLARAFERAGVDAVMVMPPHHTYVHEGGLRRYYERLAAATDRPVVPYIRDWPYPVDLLVEMTRIDGVVGMKYALEDLTKFSEAVRRSDDDVVWVNGLAEPLAPSFYLEGAEGFTAGVSNFAPQLGLELFAALERGDSERALALRDRTVPFQRLRSEPGARNEFPGANSVPAVKYGLELAGQCGGAVREPLVELSEDDKARAREYYDDIVVAVEQSSPTD